MTSLQFGRRLLWDALLWLALPSVFLLAYIGAFSAPSSAALPHLRLVLLFWFCATFARFLLGRLIQHPAAIRLSTTVLLSLAFALIVAYYAAVLVGMQSWHRVISWELITSYATQVPYLADTLEISLPVSAMVIGLIYLALVSAVWMWVGLSDWCSPLARRVSTPWHVLGTLVFSMGATVEVYGFIDAPPNLLAEPVSLTLFGDPADEPMRLLAKPLAAPVLDPVEESTRSAYAINPSADRRNVIMIVVDALRADHMGLNGYTRDTTPNLSQLAVSKDVRSTASMRSACAESLCGLSSLASSRFAHLIPDNAFTLKDVLKRHGYRIHMLLSGDHTHFYGLRERYGEVDSYFDGSMRRGEYANDDRMLFDRVDALPSWNATPTMLQFHLMSVHLLGKRFLAPAKYLPAANYNPLQLSLKGNQEGFRELAINYYDNGVVQADFVIGKLLSQLAGKGYLNNAIVVITGDHGESLGEQQLYNHANGVHEAVLRIPFLMISYGFSARPFSAEHSNPSQVDIGPTLLSELNMPVPATWVGVPMQQPDNRKFTYFQQGKDLGLIDVRDPSSVWKYWTNQGTGREYAFELTVDPAESTNRIDDVRAIAERDWRRQIVASPSSRQSVNGLRQ